MKLAVLMALPQESQGLFEKHHIPIHFSGVGKVNAAYAATKLIHHLGASAILNLGTCGSHTLAPKTFVQCRDFIQRDMDITVPGDLFPGKISAQTLDLGFTWATCGTADHIETEHRKKTYDVMDMEGYAIARVCALEKIPFYSYKFITDASDTNTRKDWLKHLEPAAKTLYDCFIRFQDHLKFTLLKPLR